MAIPLVGSGLEESAEELIGAGWVLGAGSISTDQRHRDGQGAGGSYSWKLASTSSLWTPAMTTPGMVHVAVWVGGTTTLQLAFEIGTQEQAVLQYVGTNGLLYVYKSGAGSPAGTSSSPLPHSAWHLLWIDPDLTHTGRVRVYADLGVTPILDTGVADLQARATPGYDQILFGHFGTESYVDDILVYASGDTPPTSKELFQQPPLYPNADQSPAPPSPLTPSSGTDHFALINEVGSPTTGTYNYATAAGEEELYGFTDLGITPLSIELIQVAAYVERDGTITQARVSWDPGAGQVDGAWQTIAAAGSFVTVQEFWDTDPNDASALDLTNINSGLFGVGFN